MHRSLRRLLLAASGLVVLGIGIASATASKTLETSATAAETDVEHVALLHGLGRSARSMRPFEQPLAEAGYRVHNIDYPSRQQSPEELVASVAQDLERCCADAQRLHFVTHSMGGILLRAYLAEHPRPGLGRVVMLAPPNGGSEYVDVAGNWKLFAHLLGPTAQQLGTNPESLPNRLPPPAFELGVIAGTASINPFGAMVFEGENDGTVSVRSTQLSGMRDFLELDVSHTFIVRNDEVARQTIAFLRTGAFQREE
jgi:triacylglycerol esterase/lipase EstA (alpha/beta hydrolase family)